MVLFILQAHLQPKVLHILDPLFLPAKVLEPYAS